MKFILPSLLCFLSLGLWAQTADNSAETIFAYQAEETTYEAHAFEQRRERTLLGDLDLTGFWGGPTYNYSMSGDEWAFVRGGFGGMEFGEDFFLGYGGWKSREAFNVNDDPTDDSSYDFKQGGVILAFSPNRDNAIHPRFTAIVGPGSIDRQNDDIGRDRMLLGQAMVGLELNLFQVMRLGIDGGYRFANGVDYGDITGRDVSGAIVQIEARFGFSW